VIECRNGRLAVGIGRIKGESPEEEEEEKQAKKKQKKKPKTPVVCGTACTP